MEKDIEKPEEKVVKHLETKIHIVISDYAEFKECKAVQTLDKGSHFMFITELIQSESLDGN